MNMENFKFENVHISRIRVGDTIEHHGKILTVNSNYLKKDSFMGVSLFGDSYNLGQKLVKKILI